MFKIDHNYNGLLTEIFERAKPVSFINSGWLLFDGNVVTFVAPDGKSCRIFDYYTKYDVVDEYVMEGSAVSVIIDLCENRHVSATVLTMAGEMPLGHVKDTISLVPDHWVIPILQILAAHDIDGNQIEQSLKAIYCISIPVKFTRLYLNHGLTVQLKTEAGPVLKNFEGIVTYLLRNRSLLE